MILTYIWDVVGSNLGQKQTIMTSFHGFPLSPGEFQKSILNTTTTFFHIILKLFIDCPYKHLALNNVSYCQRRHVSHK